MTAARANPFEEQMRRRELAKIHAEKKRLGLDDDVYRDTLRRVTGKDSSAAMDGRERRAVIEDLKAQAKRRGMPPRHRRKRPRNMNQPDRAAQMSKIEAYLAEAKRPWEYADSLAMRICKVDSLTFVPDGELYKIITALKKDAERHGREPASLTEKPLPLREPVR